MSVFKKLGFRVADEREMQIAFYSVRIAWFTTNVLLLAWSIQGVASTGSLPRQLIVLLLSQLAFWLANFYFNKKFGGNGKST